MGEHYDDSRERLGIAAEPPGASGMAQGNERTGTLPITIRCNGAHCDPWCKYYHFDAVCALFGGFFLGEDTEGFKRCAKCVEVFGK